MVRFPWLKSPEAEGAAGGPFGEDRLLKTVGDFRDQPASRIVARIGPTVSRFVAIQTPRDDMTVLVLKVEDRASPPVPSA